MTRVTLDVPASIILAIKEANPEEFPVGTTPRTIVAFALRGCVRGLTQASRRRSIDRSAEIAARVNVEVTLATETANLKVAEADQDALADADVDAIA